MQYGLMSRAAKNVWQGTEIYLPRKTKYVKQKRGLARPAGEIPNIKCGTTQIETVLTLKNRKFLFGILA